jgi:DNA-binding NarL/FixJ family response regulator
MARPTNALIVDDEAHVRIFLRLLLKDCGIENVWEASDGAQGLAMVESHRPELVLLDINLPVINGMEVLRLIQEEKHPGLPVVMVSSESAIKTVRDAVRLGASAYILKHSDRAEALAMLSEALDGLAEEDSESDG